MTNMLRNKKVVIFSAVLLVLGMIFFSFCCPKQKMLVRKAAFDMGSGKIKVQVADVNLATNQIEKSVFSDEFALSFSTDLSSSHDCTFSAGVQEEAIIALKKLKEKIKDFQPDQYQCIATEAFRQALNGRDAARKIAKACDIPITIISQEEEGILGFLTAVTETSSDVDSAIVWDTGGGSIQITTKADQSYFVYSLFGRIPMRNHILIEVQGKNPAKDETPHPMSQKNVEESLLLLTNRLTSPPHILYEKLCKTSGQVIGIGAHSKTLLAEKKSYEFSEVLRAIYSRIDKSETELIRSATAGFYKIPSLIMSDLILTYGVMKALNIKKVEYYVTTGGNTTGLLISEKYWHS